MEQYLALAIKATFSENIVLAYFLGMCSFLAISKKIETAMGLGLAVTFVLAITTPLNWAIYHFLLQPGALAWAGLPELDLSYLEFITFIAVIAALTQVVEMAIDKFSPPLYAALGIFLPLIAVNCAILGAALFIVEREYGPAESTIFGISSGLGFFLAITTLASIRKKLRYSNIPPALRGLGIAMLMTGLMAMVFMSFSGIQL